MATYEEQNGKLILNLSEVDENEVFIRVDCFNGTVCSLSYFDIGGQLITLNCGETGKIGTVGEIRTQQMSLDGSANNPDGQDISVLHTIYESNGTENENEISYNFTNDYTGNPPYDENDENPDYTFYVNFI